MHPVLLTVLATILVAAGCNRSEQAQPRPGAPGPEPAAEQRGDEPPAEASPADHLALLGSKENPIRCDMPAGQRAYLNRLRCPDGSPARYERLGSYGAGPHGNVLDGYRVLCGGRETIIYMDMYHPGHIETEPVPGFDIVP